MTAPTGVPPRLTAENTPFWDGLAEGRLVAERCTGCSLNLFPPRGVCRRCGSRATESVEVTGRGVVYAYTVNRHRWTPDMVVPYGLALVEFPDTPDVRVLGWVHPDHADRLQVGDAVEFGSTIATHGLHVPSFSPVDA